MTDTPHYWKLPRLYCDQKIDSDTEIILSNDQTHYLKNVMRRSVNDQIRIFDGHTGEYLTTISALTKKQTTLTIDQRIKPQPEITHRTHLLFTPLAKNRMDIIIEKATELGATDLHPILTNRTEHRKINTDRITAQITEASEQCERLALPALHPLQPLPTLINNWHHTPTIQWCSERPTNTRKPLGYNTDANQAFLIGPVGGFDDPENDYLQTAPIITPISLGSDILRAETACLLTLSARKIQLL